MRPILLLVLLGLLGLTWWALQPGPRPPAESRPGADPVDYFAETFKLTTFDATGAPARQVSGRRLAHRRHSGITELEQPRFTLFQAHRPLWTARSQSGTLSRDQQKLRLLGEVHIRRQAEADRPALQIDTRDLLIRPREEYAETDQPVQLQRGSDWLQAVGLQAWLHPPMRLKFLSRTRAYYATP